MDLLAVRTFQTLRSLSLSLSLSLDTNIYIHIFLYIILLFPHSLIFSRWPRDERRTLYIGLDNINNARCCPHIHYTTLDGFKFSLVRRENDTLTPVVYVEALLFRLRILRKQGLAAGESVTTVYVSRYVASQPCLVCAVSNLEYKPRLR